MGECIYQLLERNVERILLYPVLILEKILFRFDWKLALNFLKLFRFIFLVEFSKLTLTFTEI